MTQLLGVHQVGLTAPELVLCVLALGDVTQEHRQAVVGWIDVPLEPAARHNRGGPVGVDGGSFGHRRPVLLIQFGDPAAWIDVPEHLADQIVARGPENGGGALIGFRGIRQRRSTEKNESVMLSRMFAMRCRAASASFRFARCCASATTSS